MLQWLYEVWFRGAGSATHNQSALSLGGSAPASASSCLVSNVATAGCSILAAALFSLSDVHTLRMIGIDVDSTLRTASSIMPSAPPITVALALDPNPYHYSSSSPPTLSVTITSRAEKSLTVFAYSNILRPSLALLQKAFRITDVANETEVQPQHTIQISRGPFKRLKGNPDQEYYVTLNPSDPVTLSTTFSYNVDGYGMPRPAGHPDRIKVGAHGKSFERPVCGVDGLVPGTEYTLEAIGGLSIGWWRWGTREEVLEPEGSTEWNQGWSEEPFQLQPEDIAPVRFSVES